RAGERASSAPRERLDQLPGRPGGLPRTATAETVAVLQQAASEGRSLWIGYVDNAGAASERVVDALRMDGGHLTAYDHRSGQVRSFAVHRITGVAALDDSVTN
ncbi:MAG: WYL domain-containing protein, partial [Actinomycetes bacterium]